MTTSVDGTARLWSAGSGEQLAVFRHDSPVLDAAPSPDGARLATALEDGSAHVWDVARAAHLFALSGHQRPVSTIAFSPDGDLLATASEDRTARVWRASDGAHLRTLGSRRYEPRSATFSPSTPAEVVAGGWGFRLLIWDGSTGRLRRKLWGTAGSDVSVTRDGARAATLTTDRDVMLFADTARNSGTRIATSQRPIVATMFTPDGSALVTGDVDGTIRVIDIAKAVGGAADALLEIPAAGSGAVSALGFSSDGGTVLVGHVTGALRAHPLDVLIERCAADLDLQGGKAGFLSATRGGARVRDVARGDGDVGEERGFGPAEEAPEREVAAERGATQGIVVDTHVRRLSQRLGLSRQDDPVKIERDLVLIVPRRDWPRFPHLLIWHGRGVCPARRPRCEDCPLTDLCPSSRV